MSENNNIRYPIKKVLVIGGSGFVGGSLVPSLIEDGHDVAVMNRGHKPMQGAKQLVADRTNKAQVQEAAKNAGDFDVIIDTSSYNLQDIEIAWNNFAKKTKRWIHLSSASVYKETNGRFPTEKDNIGGAKIWGEYGTEKSEIDQFLTDHSSEVPTAILRPPYLYGPGNDNDRETFIWSRVLQEKYIIIPGDGSTTIQFLHIDDLVNIIKLLMNKKTKKLLIYNVASDECPTLKEWVETLSFIISTKSKCVLAKTYSNGYTARQYFPFRDYPCCVKTNLVKKELNWTAKYGLEDGFRQTFSKQDVEGLKTRLLDTKIEDEILTTLLL